MHSLFDVERMSFLKVLVRLAIKANKNCSPVNTKLFRSSLDLPHMNEDTPVV